MIRIALVVFDDEKEIETGWSIDLYNKIISTRGYGYQILETLSMDYDGDRFTGYCIEMVRECIYEHGKYASSVPLTEEAITALEARLHEYTDSKALKRNYAKAYDMPYKKWMGISRPEEYNEEHVQNIVKFLRRHVGKKAMTTEDE